MEQPDLAFYIDAAYGFTAVVVSIFLAASLLRARRAKRILNALEREGN